MSWWKPNRSEDVIIVDGSMEVERYLYTPGIHGVEFAKALKEGRILGMKCRDTIYVPPLTYCPDGSPGELVEVDGDWVVVTFTVVYEDMYGNKLDEPQIIAVVRPEGAEGGLIHYVKADEIYPGMTVKPVFAPENERTGMITDIKYFEPA